MLFDAEKFDEFNCAIIFQMRIKTAKLSPEISVQKAYPCRQTKSTETKCTVIPSVTYRRMHDLGGKRMLYCVGSGLCCSEKFCKFLTQRGRNQSPKRHNFLHLAHSLQFYCKPIIPMESVWSILRRCAFWWSQPTIYQQPKMRQT